MKFIILFIIIFVAGGFYLKTSLEGAPAKIYQRILNNKLDSKWYSNTNEITAVYLRPPESVVDEIPVEVKNQDLWTNFHFSDLSIPIPVKHPFFFVVPNLKYSIKKQKTKFGISIFDSSNEKISDIFFLPKVAFPNLMSSQPLFDLPLVKNELIKKTNDDIWQDLFVKDIKKTNISWQEMVYNLYLLQFRVKIFGSNILGYEKFSEKKRLGIVKLKYPNKDYLAELFLEKRGGIIHSYVIIGRKDSREAKIVRKKMLSDIGHIDTSTALSDIMIQEFKSLKYRDQVDHLGMFYLLSAWSHDQSRVEILEQLIFFLERGEANQLQLAPVYQYYYDRYNKIYSKRVVKGLNLDSKLLLKIRVMNEKNNQVEAELNKQAIPILPKKKKTIQEQFDNIINKTKIKKTRRSKIMRMD